MLSRVEKYILTKIIKKEVEQSPNHKGNIKALYQLIEDEARKEFTEDTLPSLQGFLQECFEEQQRES